MDPKRVYLVTMGCQMNVYDSEQMERILESVNYTPTSHVDKADLIILNTCSIREKAEHKVYSYLGRLVRMKRRKPDLMIGVGGCVAQQEGCRLIERAPHVDVVFGTFAVKRLADLIGQVKAQKRPVVDVDQTGSVEPSHMGLSATRAGRATAYVTIMRGCDNFCTYCVVPYLRGREVSRIPRGILQEIERLVANGVREVTLLGQNVNAYGLRNGHGCDFPTLLGEVNRIKGLKRLRFTTSHPKDLSDELVGAFASLETLAPHIHLPVQCGADRILRRMNRGYTRDDYLAGIEKLRKARPDIALTSDIIVGFPGEEERDFEETLRLVESVGFDNLYMFKYSDRPKTPASRFSHKVGEAVKRERFSRLPDLQSQMTLEKHRSLVGSIQEVLVEGWSNKMDHQLRGRTACNKVVNFSDGAACVGQLVPVKIVEAFSHSLLGSRVKHSRPYSGDEGGILHAA